MKVFHTPFLQISASGSVSLTKDIVSATGIFIPETEDFGYKAETYGYRTQRTFP